MACACFTSVYSVFGTSSFKHETNKYHRAGERTKMNGHKLTSQSQNAFQSKMFPLFNVMFQQWQMTNALVWNEIEMCYPLALYYASDRNENAAIVLSISFSSRHPYKHPLPFASSFAWCNDVYSLLVFRCALSVFIKCRCWFDIDIIRLSCRPKTMQNCDFAYTMAMQDVSINSIKPRSHTTAVAIKLSCIIYSPRI